MITNQMIRLKDLYEHLHGNKDPTEFLQQLQHRTPSSLEEELVSQLPLFDEQEEQDLTQKAQNIAQKHGLSLPDQRVFAAVKNEDEKLHKELVALGLRNVQYLLQNEFDEKVRHLFEKAKKSYYFQAEYKKITPVQLGNLKVAFIEEYAFSLFPYRSILYHILRHATNLTGQESKDELEWKIRKTFKGKKMLELGPGPGFFMHMLKEFGADVYGIEPSEEHKKQAEQAGLQIQTGTAETLDMPEEFDIIYSKDVLSFAVTKNKAESIMKAVHKNLKQGGLTVHSIEYYRLSEEEYFRFVEKSAGKEHAERMKEHWKTTDEETKEIALHKNVLNISMEHLEELGFKPLTGYRLDPNQFLTISLSK